jgi:D-xylono/L-arabinono-1,4-lactonase
MSDAAAPTPEPLADYACNTGEGPLYHPGEKKVYWTDIPNGRLFRYDPATGEHEQIYDGEPVGGFTRQADGSLLLFQARGAVRILCPDGTPTTVVEDIADERETRFNDVIADPAGRVFCGTMPTKERPGRLYRLDLDGSPTLLLEGIGCSNGMGFTPDGTGLYYTDTPKREIYLFDYNAETGDITNQRVFVRTPEGEGQGAPDGMTVDADGNVWSTRWGGSRIVCYAPDGTEKMTVMFPVTKVSSLTFAAPDDPDTMYVTTAGGHLKETDGEHAGALFRLRVPGIRGVPEFVSRIHL